MIRSPAKGLASWVAVPSPEKWRNVIRDRRLSCPCTQNHDLWCTVEGGGGRCGGLEGKGRLAHTTGRVLTDTVGNQPVQGVLADAFLSRPQSWPRISLV